MYFSYDRKNEGWHRGIIIEIWDFESVDVFFIDYGTVSRVFLHHCRFLDKRFGIYKAQAIHAKCGGIKPKKTIKGMIFLLKKYSTYSPKIKYLTPYYISPIEIGLL